MYEGRLLRKLARRAVECSKGVWVKNMAKCVGEFEWQGIGGDAIKSLTDAEIEYAVKRCLKEGEEHVDEGVGGETKTVNDKGNCPWL